MKIIVYDLKQGLFQAKHKFILLFLVIVLICWDCYADVKFCIGKCNLTYMDYILKCFEGVPPFEKVMGFEIPIMWLFIQAIITYMIGDYVVKNIHGYGMQVVMRAGSKIRWWIEKCIWCVIMISVAYVFMFAIIMIFTVITGGQLSFEITEAFVDSSVTKTNNIISDNRIMIVYLCVMPFFVSVIYGLLQMFFSVFISPVVGMIFINILYFSSSLFTKRFLIANYATFAKYDKGSGFDVGIVLNEGLWICSIALVTVLIVGTYMFNRYDILGQKEE